MADDFVTTGEFGRFREDFRAFQDRLEERLTVGFGGINDRLDKLNGRVRKNEESLTSIHSGGCARAVEFHKADSWWTPKKAAGVGIGSGGVVVGLIEVLKAVLK